MSKNIAQVINEKTIILGEKTKLDPIAIPLDSKNIYLSLDSSWHTDLESIAIWGLDFSTDGIIWNHLVTLTRNGGPAFSENNKEINVFDVQVSLIELPQNTFIRPFLGVLKGNDSNQITLNGYLMFS